MVREKRLAECQGQKDWKWKLFRMNVEFAKRGFTSYEQFEHTTTHPAIGIVSNQVDSTAHTVNENSVNFKKQKTMRRIFGQKPVSCTVVLLEYSITCRQTLFS
jgi:hypothetical protein